MGYLSALAALGANGPAAPPSPMGAPPATLGVGAPPSMPGLPPPPTGVGKMPTGDASTTKKAAGDEAILALRNLQGFVPNLSRDIDAMVDKIKNAVKPPANPGPAVGEPGPPGMALSSTDPTMDSGGPGNM